MAYFSETFASIRDITLPSSELLLPVANDFYHLIIFLREVAVSVFFVRDRCRDSTVRS